jgi:high-affinity Fe2+/Pb2+ permease
VAHVPRPVGVVAHNPHGSAAVVWRLGHTCPDRRGLWHTHPRETRDRLGIVLFRAVGGQQAAPPSALWVAAAVLGTLLAVAGLTIVPALISARTPAPQILQSERA